MAVDKSKEWQDNEQVSITRKELADIVAKRLSFEHRLMDEHILDPVTKLCIKQVLKVVCIDICALIFNDCTMEDIENLKKEVDEQITEIEEKDDGQV